MNEEQRNIVKDYLMKYLNLSNNIAINAIEEFAKNNAGKKVFKNFSETELTNVMASEFTKMRATFKKLTGEQPRTGDGDGR